MDNTITSTAQKFLEIFDITDDLLILKDGSTALIITVSAMNFGLLAEEEQDAIIYAYAGLLNSLNYPIQILIRSQTKDVTGYLHLLDEEYEQAATDNRKVWIRKYRQFVSDLIKERNVLDKKFYVVLPATALEMGLLPPSSVIPGSKPPDLTAVERSVILDKAKEILIPKRDHMLAQLGRIGLLARQLTTQEIVQLFYLAYNPEAAEGQQIIDTSSYTTPLVQASIAGGLTNINMQDQNQSQPTANQKVDMENVMPVQDNGAANPQMGTAPANPGNPAGQPGTTSNGTDQQPMTPNAAPVKPAGAPGVPPQPMTQPQTEQTPMSTTPNAPAQPNAAPSNPASLGQPDTNTAPNPSQPSNKPADGNPTSMNVNAPANTENDAQSAIDQAAGQIGGSGAATPAGTPPVNTPTPPAAPSGSATQVPPTTPVGSNPGQNQPGTPMSTPNQDNSTGSKPAEQNPETLPEI